MTTTEDRVTILLNLLDDELAERLIHDLPADRRQRVQEGLARLDQTPPSSEELDAVLEELESYLQRAFEQLDSQSATPPVEPRSKKAAESNPSASANQVGAPFQPTENPLNDLNRLDPVRLTAALRDESPVVVGLVINNLTSDRASDILQRLPVELRNAVFLRLKQKPNATRLMLEQIARATIAKASSFDELELAAENINYDERIVQILRAMDRKQRNDLLVSLEEKDPEAIAQLREMMYTIADIERLHDRTIQRMLADLDTGTLTRVLKGAPDAIQQRIFSNLSRRAREGLLEELELSGPVDDDERLAAEKKVVQTLVELDQRGELAMAE